MVARIGTLENPYSYAELWKKQNLNVGSELVIGNWRCNRLRLNAYKHYSYEDEHDPEPLAAFEFLAQENPGEQDCDRAIERS
jgi:hypothetical protein